MTPLAAVQYWKFSGLTDGKVLMRNLCWQADKADSFGHVFIACFFNESYHLPKYYRPLQAMLEREVRLICLDLVL